MGTIVVVSILFGVVLLVHERQLRSLRIAFLQRAEASEAEGQHDKAAEYLFQYLQLSQDEQEKSKLLEQIAATKDQGIKTPQDKLAAIKWYYRAVGALPNRSDLHARLAMLLLETRQFSLAEEQAKIGLGVEPSSIPCQRVECLAQFALYRQGKPISLNELTEKLAALNAAHPHDVKIATTLARIYRSHNPVTEEQLGQTADDVIDAMVDAAKQREANPSESVTSAPAKVVEENRYEPYLARYLYRTEYDLAGASEDIARAVEIAPSEPTVLLTAAQAAARSTDHRQALEFYKRLAVVSPHDTRAHLGIGQSFYKLGQTNSAIQSWRDGLGNSDPNDLAINVRLADTLLGLMRLDEAETVIGTVRNAIEGLSSSGREYLRDWAVASHALLTAKLDLARNRYPAAISTLRRVATTAKDQLARDDGVTLSHQAWILLGRTYSLLEQWEDAAVSFDRALELLPTSMESRVAAAQAWAATGRLGKAIILCEQAVHRENYPANAWALLAKLHLQAQLRLPPGERNWQQVSRVLSSATEKLPDSWELSLIQVNFLMVSDPENSLGESIQILLAAEQAHSTNVEFLNLLARTYQAMNQDSEADRVLEMHERLTNASLESSLLRADLLSIRGRFASAKEILEKSSPSNDEQIRLRRSARIRIAMREGNSDALNDVLVSEHTKDPQNAQLLSQLVDLAFRESRDTDFRKWLAELAKVEGDNGPLWRYYEARRLLAGQPSRQDLQAAKVLLGDIERLRPWWPGGTFLKGLIAEKRSKNSEAIRSYVAVLRSGLQTPEVYRRLLQALYNEGRISEAEQYARLMQSRYPIARTFTGNTIAKDDQDGQLLLATQIARASVEQNPSDVSARHWLARLLMMSGEFAGAEQELISITRSTPNDLHAWSLLFSYYLRTNQASQAAKAVEQMSRLADADNPEKHFVLAQAHELLGNGTRAEAHYQEAIRIQPKNVAAMLRYCSFLMPFDSHRAEEYARTAVQVEPENPSARRMLAMVLGMQNGKDAQTEASQLIATNLSKPTHENGVHSGVYDGVDRRLHAILLLRRGTEESIADAERILRTLADEGRGTKVGQGDRLLLADLLERKGEIAAAAEQYSTLAQEEDITSRHLAAYVAFLIRHQKYTDADESLLKLEQQAPHSLLTIRLRCHLLSVTGRPDLASEVLNRFADEQLRQLEGDVAIRKFMLSIAESFVTLKQTESAETWYRRLNDRFPDQVEHLALYLARHQKTASAIELCVDSLQREMSPETVVALVKVLILQPESAVADIDRSRTGRLIQDTVRRFPNHEGLIFYVANLRLKQRKTDAAVQLYRRLVSINPQHVLAWNNLAALLAEQPDGLEEAIRCADRALEAAGYSVPTVVDTKAMVLMQQGHFDEAADLLAEIIRSPNGKDARFYFHLAVALQRSGRTENATKSLAFAKDLGLDEVFLTNREAELLADVEKRLQK